MKRIDYMLTVLLYCVVNSNGRSENYQVFIENVTDCQNPRPPYHKKPMITGAYSVQQRKNTQILSGHYLVVEEVPFLNFSEVSYKVDKFGKEEVQVTIENVSCQNWVAKIFLTTGKIRYNKKDCRVRKGTYKFSVDLNAVFHSVPNYHEKGMIRHNIMLVYKGYTVFCNNVYVNIK